MKPAGLSKSRILNHRQCAKRLWLQTHRPELLDETIGQAAMAAGIGVGELARTHYPDGVLIDAEDLREALRRSAAAVASRPRRPIFEGTFEHQGVLVRTDVLRPATRGWDMVEVKSSASVKDYQVEDAAIQAWVLQGAGLAVRRKAVSHIDSSFVYPGGGDYIGLFVEEDVGGAVDTLLPEVPDWAGEARRTLALRKEPVVAPGPQCNDPYACPFQAHCIPETEGYPVSILPHGGNLAAQLEAEGYADLREVPGERLSRDLHRRVWSASRSGRAFLDRAVRDVLGALPFPRNYIDFETYGPAIPIWAGTRPFQKIPFQWSCHIQSADGGLQHREFLAEGSEDPRRLFIRTLLDVLGTKGPILVWYQPFEEGRLREIAEVFPELAGRIEKVANRLVDLLPLAREHYYHPDMMGSWSIKSVLPTIAPELAYENLKVRDGSMAQEAFAKLLDQNVGEKDRQEMRGDLLEYCRRDTLAMVRIAECFAAAS